MLRSINFKPILTMIGGGLIVLLIGYGLGCHKGKTIIKDRIVTVTIHDTIEVSKLVPHYVTVLKRDTTVLVKYVDKIQYVDKSIKGEDVIKYTDKEVIKEIRIPADNPILVYQDSIKKPNYTFAYKIRTLGALDSFDYNITMNQLPVKQPTTKKFFSNLLLGYHLDNDKQIGGQIGYNKLNVGYLYGLDSHTHNILLGYKLF